MYAPYLQTALGLSFPSPERRPSKWRGHRRSMAVKEVGVGRNMGGDSVEIINAITLPL